MRDVTRWAENEFGQAELGDTRRTRRLVQLAAEVANRPAGKVTQACVSSASREGAFRLLENDAVRPEAIRSAMVGATLERCRGQRRVLVPTDGSSLTLTDLSRAKGLGAVGSWNQSSRGLHTMTALAVAADGTPLGLCGQRTWVREARSKQGRCGARREDSETRFWLELLLDTHQAFAEQAPDCTPWFQMDRGADCEQVFALACEHDRLVTVRAAHDRCVNEGANHLWSVLERAPVVAKRKIEVPARPPMDKKKRIAGKRIHVLSAPRPARGANVTIRAATVAIQFTASGGKVTRHLNAVLVREKSRSDARIEWLLLTTHPIRRRRDVLEIVRGYTLRWRIEDFHRTWKRGLCRVEDTQLRSRNAILKWATLLAAVATRAMRLTHLARTAPTARASTELSRTELAALMALRQPKGIVAGAVPSLAEAVRWLADLGGYTGPWNGPPGPTVVGRGLYDVLVAARAFENHSKKR